MQPEHVQDDSRSALLATFYVKESLCALRAAGVQEVIRRGPVTVVDRAAGEVAGIVNLRGRIVTVLDMGVRLGLGPIVENPANRIFIIEDRGEFIGLLVDRAGEVVEVDSAAWQPVPASVPAHQARLLEGVCRSSAGLIVVVSAAKALAEE